MFVPWALVGGVWLYETVVFIVWLLLPLIGISEAAAYATPLVTKWLVLGALVLNFIIFAYMFINYYKRRRTPRAHMFHFAAAVWLWIWPTVGSWWWDSEFDGGDSPVVPANLPTGVISVGEAEIYTTNTRSYNLWKFVLEVGVSGAFIVTMSALILVAMYFEKERRHTSRRH